MTDPILVKIADIDYVIAQIELENLNEAIDCLELMKKGKSLRRGGSE